MSKWDGTFDWLCSSGGFLSGESVVALGLSGLSNKFYRLRLMPFLNEILNAESLFYLRRVVERTIIIR